MTRRILAFIVVLIAIMAGIILFYVYRGTPIESVKHRIKLIQMNKQDQLDLNTQDFTKIQEMLRLQSKGIPDTHYAMNPASTEQMPIVDVFFTYLLPGDGEEIIQAFHGILEFELSKVGFNRWDVEGVKVIKQLEKQSNVTRRSHPQDNILTKYDEMDFNRIAKFVSRSNEGQNDYLLVIPPIIDGGYWIYELKTEGNRVAISIDTTRDAYASKSVFNYSCDYVTIDDQDAQGENRKVLVANKCNGSGAFDKLEVLVLARR